MLRDAESQGAPSDFNVHVDVASLPVGDFRADFDAQLDTWLVRGTARVMDGRFVIDSLHVEFGQFDPNTFDPTGELPLSPTHGITGELLRRIPVGRLLASVRREVLAAPKFDDLAPVFGREVRPEVKRGRKKAASAVEGNVLGQGRPRLGTGHYPRGCPC